MINDVSFKRFSELHKENVPQIEAQRAELKLKQERDLEIERYRRICPKWGCGSIEFKNSKR